MPYPYDIEEPDSYDLAQLPVTRPMYTITPDVPFPDAQPEFHYFPGTEPEADFDFPEMSYPAMDAFRQFIEQQPTREQYQPSKWRRALGAAGGFSAGWQQGPQAGINVATGIVDTPYRQALENWKLGLAPRQGAAAIEASETGHLLTAAYHRARLKQLGARVGGAAAMGNPIALYNRKTDTTRWVQKFRDGTFRDASNITGPPVPGPGPDEEQRVQQFHTFEQIANVGGVPTVTQSELDKQRFANKGPSAVIRSNEPVAESGEVGVNKMGEQVAVTGRKSGTQKPITKAAQPGQEFPETVRRQAMPEIELSKQDYINQLAATTTRLSQLYPTIKGKLGSISGLFHQYAPNELILALKNHGIKIDDDLLEFINLSRDLTADEIRRRSGVAFKDWEMSWAVASAPTYRSPNWEASMRKYMTGINLMMSNRNMNPDIFKKAMSDAGYSTPVPGSKSDVKPPPSTPQTKLPWVVDPTDGSRWVLNPITGKYRAARPGDILDPSMQIKKGSK